MDICKSINRFFINKFKINVFMDSLSTSFLNLITFVNILKLNILINGISDYNL